MDNKEEEDEPNMNEAGVTTIERKTALKNKESLKGEFFDSSTGKKLQNKDKKKDDQNIDNSKSLKDSAKDKSKTSDDDTLKIDGSTVGITKSKEVDKTLKVTEGGNMFDTPQKDAVDKKSTPKAKMSGGSGTKRLIFKTTQDGKESTSTPKRSKRKTSVLEFFSPDQK